MGEGRPLDWVLVSPGLPHHGGTLAERSLGGSETAAICVARALVQRGHHVTVLSPGHQGGLWDGVQYLPIESAPLVLGVTPHDVTVISRAMEYTGVHIASPVRILWTHDLGLKRNRGALGAAAWQLDAVFGVSEWHAQQLRDVHQHLPGKTFVATRNGVWLDDFVGLRDTPRDPWLLVYGSRPERGLDGCLAVMQQFARQGRPWRLEVSHYDNTTPQMAPLYEALWAKARSLPNVVLRGPMTQAEWRRQLARARALLYPGCPGDFREVSCIAAIEAMACGTPIVAAARGALPETIAPEAALWVGDEKSDPYAADVLAAFAAQVESLVDDTRWQRCHEAGLLRAREFDWSGVAVQWERFAWERIASRTAAAERVRAHLRAIGDHEAAAAMEGR